MEKRLYRSRNKKVIAGLGGGLGEYLDIDPVIIRIIIVLTTIFHGIGLLIYIIMWIVVPEEPFDQAFAKKETSSDVDPSKNAKNETTNTTMDINEKSGSSNGRIIVGVILILIGLVFLSERFFPFLDFEFVFAVGLIVLGVSLLVNFFNKTEKLS